MGRGAAQYARPCMPTVKKICEDIPPQLGLARAYLIWLTATCRRAQAAILKSRAAELPPLLLAFDAHGSSREHIQTQLDLAPEF